MISVNLIDSIKSGMKASARTAYRCTPRAVLTIGWGRCVDSDEPGTGITEAEAEMLLAERSGALRGSRCNAWTCDVTTWSRARSGPPRGNDRDVLQHGTGQPC